MALASTRPSVRLRDCQREMSSRGSGRRALAVSLDCRGLQQATEMIVGVESYSLQVPITSIRVFVGTLASGSEQLGQSGEGVDFGGFA